MATKKELTLREKFAIKGYASKIIHSWYDVYKIAYDGKLEQVESLKTIQSIVSRWKHSKLVNDYYNECLYLYNKDEERKKQAYIREAKAKGDFQAVGEDGKVEEMRMGNSEAIQLAKPSAKPKLVDFSNPQNQMQKLNELVNSATDSAETLDALKVIISTQKADRDAAKEGRQVKAYIPMTCSQCPMYRKALKKTTI